MWWPVCLIKVAGGGGETVPFLPCVAVALGCACTCNVPGRTLSTEACLCFRSHTTPRFLRRIIPYSLHLLSSRDPVRVRLRVSCFLTTHPIHLNLHRKQRSHLFLGRKSKGVRGCVPRTQRRFGLQRHVSRRTPHGIRGRSEYSGRERPREPPLSASPFTLQRWPRKNCSVFSAARKMLFQESDSRRDVWPLQCFLRRAHSISVNLLRFTSDTRNLIGTL